MLADYDFYQKEYKGIVITDANSYGYFGERASDELALYSHNKAFSDNEEATKQLKKCACRIADILYSSTNGGKSLGKSVTSESVAGYYSVSYAQSDETQVKMQINTAIKLYIGKYILSAKKVLW